jgi:hypothetical protein
MYIQQPVKVGLPPCVSAVLEKTMVAFWIKATAGGSAGLPVSNWNWKLPPGPDDPGEATLALGAYGFVSTVIGAVATTPPALSVARTFTEEKLHEGMQTGGV